MRIKKTQRTAQTRYDIAEPCLYEDKIVSGEFQSDAMNTVDLWSEDDGNQQSSVVSLQKLVSNNMQEHYPITPSSPVPQRRRSMIKNTSGCGMTHDRRNSNQSSASNFP